MKKEIQESRKLTARNSDIIRPQKNISCLTRCEPITGRVNASLGPFHQISRQPGPYFRRVKGHKDFVRFTHPA
jgi:hypothetical protein